MARVREFDTEAAVDAALSAFRRRGYEGTSVQDLVDATGVGRGSLYAAFGSKDGLYLAAMDRYREIYALPLIEVLRCGAPVREIVRQILAATVDDVVRDGSRQSCLVITAATERAAHDPKVAGRVRETLESIEEALTDLIGEGRASGQLAGSHPPRDVARFLMTTMQGLRVMGAVAPERRSLMAIVEVALLNVD